MIIILVLTLIIKSCSGKNDTVDNPVPDSSDLTIYNDSYYLEINKSNVICKVSYRSYNIERSFDLVYTFYNDSIIQNRRSAAGASRSDATYYLNKSGRADSCHTAS
jgi:hypothetical protein